MFREDIQAEVAYKNNVGVMDKSCNVHIPVPCTQTALGHRKKRTAVTCSINLHLNTNVKNIYNSRTCTKCVNVHKIGSTTDSP
jgi:hypothetical protein